MWRELSRLGAALLADDGVRVVVLRAEGASFSAGLDRAMLEPRPPEPPQPPEPSRRTQPPQPPEPPQPSHDHASVVAERDAPSLAALAALGPAELDAVIASFQSAFSWWRDDRVVSVAAVGGHAVGAGFQLALACDLRVLAADAQFAMRETTLGLVPDLGGTKPLVDIVGYPRALEICATGRWVHAEEAIELGLAEMVVPRADLDGATDDLCAALLAAPAGALAETKALLREAGGRTYGEQLAAERAAQGRLLRDLVGGA